MEDPTLISRLQFAFTIVYHYLFPQLTMGLALLLVVLKTLYLRRGDETYNVAAQFWGKIFAITFVMGVVTGIPMEFQFGTNWAVFSAFAGDIIAQTLAMEGAFAFFLESAFLGIFLFGERRFGQRVHWFSALMVFLGTWASGYFILATNAWMQNPTVKIKTVVLGTSPPKAYMSHRSRRPSSITLGESMWSDKAVSSRRSIVVGRVWRPPPSSSV